MKGIIPSEFGKNVEMWVGFVEDRGDPQQRGRVRVRILGKHTDDKTLIPTEALPWAMVVQPITSAAVGGVGVSPTGIMIGTMVTGYFLDGKDMQMPIVLGVIGPIEGVTSAGPSGNGTINSDGIEDTNSGLPGNVTFSDNEPPWLSIAKGEIGVKEFAGSNSNPRILEYHKSVGLNVGDSVPWCSSFVAWCLKKAGISTAGGSGMARSWATASSMEKISTPVRGCIAVFSRPPSPTSGHVGFVDAIQGGSLILVHGNSNDSVARSGKSMQRLVGFYWPKGHPKEKYGVNQSNEKVATGGRES
jgi:uncharacterized protein (TIGR02594 family)